MRQFSICCGDGVGLYWQVVPPRFPRSFLLLHLIAAFLKDRFRTIFFVCLPLFTMIACFGFDVWSFYLCGRAIVRQFLRFGSRPIPQLECSSVTFTLPSFTREIVIWIQGSGQHKRGHRCIPLWLQYTFACTFFSFLFCLSCFLFVCGVCSLCFVFRSVSIRSVRYLVQTSHPSSNRRQSRCDCGSPLV